MHANRASSAAASATSLRTPRSSSCDASPLIIQGDLGVGAFLAPRQQLQQQLPTPRLAVLPLLAQRTLVIAAGLDVSDSPLGPFQALLVGPLVTYAALREGFWGQRHSLGLYPLWTSVSSLQAALWLHRSWGVEADVAPLHLSLAGEQALPAAAAGLQLKGPGWGGYGLQRDAYLYTRQGCRLCSSRLTLQGSLRLTAGGARALGLVGPIREQLPRASGPSLASLFLQGAELTCYGPGRCYDL